MIEEKKYVRIVTNKDLPKIGDSVVINNQNIKITENGLYEAGYPYTGFGRVEVEVLMPAGSLYKPVEDGVVNKCNKLPDMTGITRIGQTAYKSAFETSIFGNNEKNVVWNDITVVDKEGMYYCFYKSNITSFSMDGLVSIDDSGLASVCYSCENFTSVSLSNLETVEKYGLSYAFGFTKLENLSLPKLKTVKRLGLTYTCEYCHRLKNVYFDALSDLTDSPSIYSAPMGSCFAYCGSLENIYFGALTSNSFGIYTNQFNQMLYNVNGCTVHFPSNLQSVIGSWSDVVNGFGGTNTTVLFDLPATE